MSSTLQPVHAYFNLKFRFKWAAKVQTWTIQKMLSLFWSFRTSCTFLRNAIPEAFALIQPEPLAEREEVVFTAGTEHRKWPTLEESKHWVGRHSAPGVVPSNLSFAVSTVIPYYRCENTESETASNRFKVSTRSTEEIWSPGPSDSKTGFHTTLHIHALSPLEFIQVPLAQAVSLSLGFSSSSLSLWVSLSQLIF